MQKENQKPMELIDPTYDSGFKLTFGRVGVSEDVLKELLNSIFEGDPELSDIRSVSYMNPEKEGEYSGHKGIRYDILCQTGSGYRFIVEMQKSWQRYFVKRAEYYYSRAVAEQGLRGRGEEALTWDYNYIPVVGVYICQQRIKGLPPKLITRCRLTDEATGEPIGSTMRFVYIQLPFVKATEEECEEYFDEFSFNLKNMGKNQYVAFQSKREIFRRLAEIAKVATLTPEQARMYEADVKIARDYYNELEGARIEGREQGFLEGHQEGRLEGRQEGAWGKLRKIVMNLRMKGMDNSTIASLLDESPEVVASI